MRGIHRSPENSPHKGQWRGSLMISLIFAWLNCWVNKHEAGDLRRHRAHYDVIVMHSSGAVSISRVVSTREVINMILWEHEMKSNSFSLIGFEHTPSYRTGSLQDKNICIFPFRQTYLNSHNHTMWYFMASYRVDHFVFHLFTKWRWFNTRLMGLWLECSNGIFYWYSYKHCCYDIPCLRNQC